MKAIELLRELIEPAKLASQGAKPDSRRAAHGDAVYRAQQIIAADFISTFGITALNVRHLLNEGASESSRTSSANR